MTVEIMVKELNPHVAELTLDGNRFEIPITKLLELAGQCESLYHKMVEDAR